MKGIPWTKEEESIIISFYFNTKKEEMMSMLPDRTWKAIRSKGVKLGLKLSNNYEPIEDEELFKVVNKIKYMKCKSCRRYLPCDFLHYPKDRNMKLGIRNICKECKGENFGTKDYWSLDEDRILLEFYSAETGRYIQKIHFPYRTLEQINHRAASLHLHKTIDTRHRSRIESQTDEWKDKISKTKKSSGVHKGENNSMYGSHRIGELNPNWRGGISNLYSHLRRNLTKWKLDSAKDCDYKCVLTGKRFDDIHHLYNFQNIIQETFLELDIEIKDNIGEYSMYEFITEKCLEIHYRYPFGVCLQQKVHRLFHEIYGFINNNPEQFEEFKEKYNKGEFMEVLNSDTSFYLREEGELIASS
jgi:hypothetical protein